MDLNYTKRIVNAPAPGAYADSEFSRARLNPKTPRQVLDRVGKFSDGKYIMMFGNNLLITFNNKWNFNKESCWLFFR